LGLVVTFVQVNKNSVVYKINVTNPLSWTGRFFAAQEIKFALIELLRNYDVKIQSGKRPLPYHDFMGMNVRNCEDPLVFTPRV
jgi:hypothetical protein